MAGPRCAHAGHGSAAVATTVRSTGSVDEDEGLTEAAIDAEFERTQWIGNAINALAQAELAVAAVDELPPDVVTRLDRILGDAFGREGG